MKVSQVLRGKLTISLWCLRICEEAPRVSVSIRFSKGKSRVPGSQPEVERPLTKDPENGSFQFLAGTTGEKFPGSDSYVLFFLNLYCESIAYVPSPPLNSPSLLLPPPQAFTCLLSVFLCYAHIHITLLVDLFPPFYSPLPLL